MGLMTAKCTHSVTHCLIKVTKLQEYKQTDQHKSLSYTQWTTYTVHLPGTVAKIYKAT